MDSTDAWDLEMELLLLPAQGGSVRKMQRLSQCIGRVCGPDVPQHIQELGAIRDSTHRERDLHRWVSRQVWRGLLPEMFEFDLPYTPDQINEEATGKQQKYNKQYKNKKHKSEKHNDKTTTITKHKQYFFVFV